MDLEARELHQEESTQDVTDVIPIIVDGPTVRQSVAARLICVAGADLGRTFRIGPRPVVIGRGVADVPLTASDVSRHHARLSLKDNLFTLEDLGSLCGNRSVCVVAHPHRMRTIIEKLRDSAMFDSVKIGAGSDSENAELFRLLVNSVRDYAIFMLDPTGHVVTWNSGAETIKRYTAKEIIGKHLSVFYPPEDVAAGKCERELEVAARVGRCEDEGWRIRKDGTRFWANVVISAVRDTDGELIGFSKVTRDLTERKGNEEEVIARLAAEERFRLLIESVRDYAIFMLDPAGNIATWNAGAERIKGYTASEIIGSHFSRFYREDEKKSGKCEYELVEAARVGRFEDEGWRLRKDGTEFWASVVISAVRDATGTLVGFSKVTRDLTERKRADDEMAARLAAEQANRTKDEFLAMLGHELRNPLAPIATALELMKLRGDSNSWKEQDIIDRQVTHMIRLVDDLLDVSRIARGTIELKRRPTDLREAIAKGVEIASPLFEQREQHFKVHIPSQVIAVNGDESRLTQVFANLFTNAAKYTNPGGHIDVSASLADGEVLVEVRDDGIGIDPALLPRVFDLFVQGYQSPDRAVGGLGLGLTLVRTLVRLHDGRVDVRSDGLGKGSTFSVTLPLVDRMDETARRGRPAPIALAAEADRQRVLIVDDNEDARVLLAEILETVGHVVETAGDPIRALEVVKSFKPQVAILDLGLPVMDGYELAARMREDRTYAMPRLLALTGYGQEHDRERCIGAGFDEHFVKPVNLEALIKCIAPARG